MLTQSLHIREEHMEFLPGFTAGLLLINLSELGDKTFFIGMILAMRHPRRLVFLGTTFALVMMTILSVLLGQITVIFPEHYVQGFVVALFFGFGLKLLYDASRMATQKGGSSQHEQEEALSAVNQRESGIQSWSTRAVLIEAFSLTFLAEWGDRTQLATITLAAAHPLSVSLSEHLSAMPFVRRSPLLEAKLSQDAFQNEC